MTKETYYGMLAAIDWNSNDWKAPATPEDVDNAAFGSVSDNQLEYSSLNFGHAEFPTDEAGWYAGFLPQLHNKTLTVDTVNHLKVVFIKAKNWHDNTLYIIGFYGLPMFQKGRKTSPIPNVTHIVETNIKSQPKHIHLLANPVNLDDQAEIMSFLPKDKKLGKRGVNYLTKINVEKILDAMTRLNPDDKTLSSIKLALLRAIGNS